MAVPDGKGLRRLTIREGLRLFGYPEWYKIPTKEYDAFDLLGNTVAVPVVEFVVSRVAETMKNLKHGFKGLHGFLGSKNREIHVIL